MLLIIFFDFSLFIFLIDFGFLDILFIFFLKEKMFFLCLIFVVLVILIFLNFYMDNDKNILFFFFCFFLFIFRIIVVNFSGNLITLLVSWDILGVSSYFLVLFYGN